jgi:hypothetical protein
MPSTGDEPPRQPPGPGGRPGPPERLATAERLARIVTGLTIQNVLTIGLLVLIAVPAVLSWQLTHDPRLREQFLSSARVVDGVGIPCLVIATSLVGQTERMTVIVAYDTDGRIELDVGARSPGIMTGAEMAKACELVRKHASILRNALGAPSESK